MERFQLPPDVDALEEITRFVHRLAEAAGFGPEKAYRLRLAAEELSTNIVVHGYGDAAPAGGGHGGGCLEVEGGVEEDRVWIRFVDSAPPFAPTSAPPPANLDRPLVERDIGGLGLYLARRSVDELRYEHADGKNRTTLVMRRAEEVR